MKAIVRSEYGSPEVLQLKDLEKPVPKDNEVLIKVRAASVNASDYEFLTGSPLYTRMWGLRKPKITILGSDVAGVVDSVGKNATKFRPGDAVFGDIFEHWGGFAEYVCVPEKTLFLKPESLNFEEASALPQAACIALQGLQNIGQVKPGQNVLINGAGGGAGTFAIQIGKLMGAHVTAVDSALKFELMRTIGADHVIDYRSEDFTKNGQEYDLILDLVASHSIFAYKRSLTSKGEYSLVGGTIPHVLQTMVFGSIISLFGTKKMGLFGIKPNMGLDYVLQLINEEKLHPAIDKTYALYETPEALRYLGKGLAKGKLVITM